MSNIKYDNKYTGIVIDETITLQKAITDVTKKLGISDEGIEWIIFDEKNYLDKKMFKNGMLLPSYVYKNVYKYGFCYVKEKQIWISTAAIRTYKTHDISIKLSKMLGKPCERVLLIDVILDELAHIKTGKNHGDTEYDETLANYHQKYYMNQFYIIASIYQQKGIIKRNMV